jgi:CMP-N-acetylneuraminic acid synthetase
MHNPLPKIVALVPMRHHSERVPGKNYRSFGGVPLYHHIVLSLLHCARISQIVIDTDSPTIRSDAAEHFPDVTVIDRPKELLGSEVPMNHILLHDISVCAADFYLQTHSTNPLLRPLTIARAVDAFLDTFPEYDSLFSVTALRTRLWSMDRKPINHDPGVLLRTQDLPPVFQENSNIYIFTAECLRKHVNRIGQYPLLFEIAPDEAMDIDEEFDFRIAEQMYLIKQSQGV